MTGREEDLLRLTAREGPLSLFCALSVSACLPPTYLRSGSLRREVKVKSLSRVRLCDPMDCSLPGSSVHGVLQARILEWVAISLSRGSSRPRDHTRVSRIAGRHFTL